jgi:protein-L-isoaspartate(D-aspartate) O-methyltransferase
MEDFAAARRKMVDSQLRTEGVTDYAVLAAMGEVPREIFVPARQRPIAYLDRDIPLTDGPAAGMRYLMQPAALARLLQLPELNPTDRVLAIGTSSGYSAAVLSGLVASVVALESDPGLALQAARNLADLGLGNVEGSVGPLEQGSEAGAPYDAIVVDGAVETIPEAVFSQLAEGGRMAAIVGYGRTGVATLFTLSEGRIGQRGAFDASVPPLPGFRKPEVFVF